MNVTGWHVQRLKTLSVSNYFHSSSLSKLCTYVQPGNICPHDFIKHCDSRNDDLWFVGVHNTLTPP